MLQICYVSYIFITTDSWMEEKFPDNFQKEFKWQKKK